MKSLFFSRHRWLPASRQFGRAVRGLRLVRGKTQQQVADFVGVDIGYIGQIERGLRNPTLGVMRGIAAALKVELSELLQIAGL